MKIAVIGNCQAEVISQCLMAMNRNVHSTSYTADHSDVLGADLGENDVIFSTPFIDRPLEEAVPSTAGKIIYYPRVVFPAFTPDIVYAQAGGQWIQSPLSDYNSSLILYAWRQGLSFEETKALFCAEIFERVGFCAFVETSKQELLREGVIAGFPIVELLDKWLSSGRFMHSINHPKIGVLADIARVLAKKAGIEVLASRVEDYIADPMISNAVWPVYPGLSEAWSHISSYDFKVPPIVLVPPPSFLSMNSSPALSPSTRTSMSRHFIAIG